MSAPDALADARLRRLRASSSVCRSSWSRACTSARRRPRPPPPRRRRPPATPSPRRRAPGRRRPAVSRPRRGGRLQPGLRPGPARLHGRLAPPGSTPRPARPRPTTLLGQLAGHPGRARPGIWTWPPAATHKSEAEVVAHPGVAAHPGRGPVRAGRTRPDRGLGAGSGPVRHGRHVAGAGGDGGARLARRPGP